MGAFKDTAAGLKKVVRQFEKEMVELAEEVARRLLHEEVIVEIQVNGITQNVIGVEP